ncbi:MAG: ABC transporter ATP-binding protein [Candidatus Hodarchaeota archaeon]
MSKEDSIIVVQGASKEYKRGREVVQALRAVNLEIKKGELVCIFGPSGSGKTTLLNVLSGLDQPSVGRVILDGTDTSVLDERLFPKIRREKVGFVFQDFNLVPDMTTIENVESPLWPSDMKAKEIENKALALLREVDLLERKDHRPKQLSGGEQQRAAIARALVNDPTVLFADEPTGNLDTKTGQEIMKLLRRINKEQGTTVIVVTHDQTLLEYSDRAFNIVDGRVTEVKSRKTS